MVSRELMKKKNFCFKFWKYSSINLGDRLVATANQSQNWSSPQNVNLTLSYPKTGIGATVSHVLIYVEQVIF